VVSFLKTKRTSNQLENSMTFINSYETGEVVGHSPIKEGCPHCGAEPNTAFYWKCGTNHFPDRPPYTISELCQERQARQKAESELSKLKEITDVVPNLCREVDTTTDELEKLEAENTALKDLFGRLEEEIECGPECASHYGTHCNCSRLKRANKVLIEFSTLTKK
jgi:hypothetical protein